MPQKPPTKPDQSQEKQNAAPKRTRIGDSPEEKAAPAREARLAEALRANLRRRKKGGSKTSGKE